MNGYFIGKLIASFLQALAREGLKESQQRQQQQEQNNNNDSNS